MNFEYSEGATPIDPDEARGLLLPHIRTRAELDRWGQENLTNAGDCRRRYIEALRSADRYNYEPLLDFVRS